MIPDRNRSTSVQSLERAFSLLEILADHNGRLGLSEIAAAAALPAPTVHRLIRTLVQLGYLRQESSRQYALGPRLIRLGDSSSRLLNVWSRPHLHRLVDELGETANLAVLDGDELVYMAQMQSRQSMRMFTEVGRRVLPHCTAVGKTLLAGMSRGSVRDILARTGMPRHTDQTITSPDAFNDALDWVTAHGYALDDGEQEVGVRCVAVAVPDAPAPMALSVSGPLSRMSESTIARAVPLLQSVARALSADLNSGTVAFPVSPAAELAPPIPSSAV